MPAALAVVIWALRLVGPFGPTWVGELSYLLALGYRWVAGPALLVVGGLLWMKRLPAERHDELQRRLDAAPRINCGYDLRTLPDCCLECGALR